MSLNLVYAIWKQFFGLSKTTEEANKKERCNLDGVESLEDSYSLRKLKGATSMPLFSARVFCNIITLILGSNCVKGFRATKIVK